MQFDTTTLPELQNVPFFTYWNSTTGKGSINLILGRILYAIKLQKRGAIPELIEIR